MFTKRQASVVLAGAMLGFLLAQPMTAMADPATGGGELGGYRAEGIEFPHNGIWSYGVSRTPLAKYCYSDYFQNTLYHSSTAKIGSSPNKDYASAGYWSNASIYGPTNKTAYAYWNTY